jgi:hypothetical protein
MPGPSSSMVISIVFPAVEIAASARLPYFTALSSRLVSARDTRSRISRWSSTIRMCGPSFIAAI